MSPGPALDGRIVPPQPHPAAGSIGVRWSAVVTYKFASVDPVCVTSGTLDPAIGMVPIDQVAIAFADVISIAVWRKIAWSNTIVGFLVPAPIAILFFWGAIAARSSLGGAAILALFGLLFGALAAYMVRRGLVVGRRFARVVGRYGSLSLQFDRSHDLYRELFRRSGLPAPPIP